MYIPFETNAKGRHSFVVDVSIDWATGRRRQTTLVDTTKIPKVNLLVIKVLTTAVT